MPNTHRRTRLATGGFSSATGGAVPKLSNDGRRQPRRCDLQGTTVRSMGSFIGSLTMLRVFGVILLLALLTPSASSQTTLPISAGAAKAPATGRSLVNIGPMFEQNGGGGLFPFINYMKACENGDQSNAFPNDITSDGYPYRSPMAGNIGCFGAMENGTEYRGSWIFAWKGRFGTGSGKAGRGGVILSIDSGRTMIRPSSVSCADGITNPVVKNDTKFTGNLTLTGTDCVIVFSTPSAPQGYVRITFLSHASVGGNVLANIANIALCRSDQVNSVNDCLADRSKLDGSEFTPTFLAYERRLNARIIRFLDWVNGPGSNRSRLRFDAPMTAMSWNTNRFYVNGPNDTLGVWAGTLHYGAAEGCTAGDHYCVAAPTNWEGLVDGSTIQALINHKGGGPGSTLNVGNSGDVPVRDLAAERLGTRVPSKGEFPAPRLATFVYDALDHAWLWGQPSSGVGWGLTQAVPFKVQIDLCNVLHKDCEIEVPMYFATSTADEQSLAKLVADNLDPGLNVYFEYSNENWNPSWVAWWLSNRGNAVGLPAPSSSALGGLPAPRYSDLATRNMCVAMKAAWPAGKSGFHCIITQFILASEYATEERLIGAAQTFDADGMFTTGTVTTTVANSSIAPNQTLTLGATPTGPIYRGMKVAGNGLGTCATTKVYVAEFNKQSILPTNAWVSGTIHVNSSPIVRPETLTFCPGGTGKPVATDYTKVGARLGDYVDDIAYAMYSGGIDLPDGGGCYLAPAGKCYARGFQAGKKIKDISNTKPGILTVAGASASWANGDRIRLTGLGNSDKSGTITAFIDDGQGHGSYDGVAGNVLTVTAGRVDTGYVLADYRKRISALPPTNGLVVTGRRTGTGGPGTYIVNVAQAVASETMTANFSLNGAWVTIANLGLRGADTFEISKVSSAGGVTMTSDLTEYGRYGGTGGSAERLSSTVPGLSPGLLAAADNYASGTPNKIASALNWYDHDLQESLAQLDPYFQAFSRAAVIWSRVVGRTIGIFSYEGGYTVTPPTAGTVNALGIDPSYFWKVSSLIQGYEYSRNLANTWLQFYEHIVSYKNTFAPAQYEDVAAGYSPVFHGSIAPDGTLSVNGTYAQPSSPITTPTIVIGTALKGVGIDPKTVITGFLTGRGGNGTYMTTPKGQSVPFELIFPAMAKKWAMNPGDMYSQPYQSFNGQQTFNNRP
jgi:hypothetical protein